MEKISDISGIIGAGESLAGGREENQDSFIMVSQPAGFLAVVCDGMGGAPGGKRASAVTAQAIVDFVTASDAGADPSEMLKEGAGFAHGRLVEEMKMNPSLRGMGATCVAVLIRENMAYVMHVGDSRFYKLHEGDLDFRTSDHSHVGELVRMGSMTEEEARVSHYSNIISRVVGGMDTRDVQPELDSVELLPGDRLVLMTDGIWGAMPEPELVGLLGSDDAPDRLVESVTALVDAIGTRNGGHHDNLTLVVLDIRREETAPETAAAPAPADEPQEPDDSLTGPEENEDAPEENDTEYFFEDEEGKSFSASRRILILALIVLVGAVVWLFCSGKIARWFSDEEPTKIEIIKPKAAPDSTVNADTLRKKPAAVSQETAGSTAKTESVPRKEKEKPATENPAAGQDDGTVDKAVATLLSLKKLKPLKSEKGRSQVETRRAAIIRQTVENLRDYASGVQSEEKRRQILNAADGISRAANKMKRVDGINRFSTKDANTAIDREVSRLRRI